MAAAINQSTDCDGVQLRKASPPLRVEAGKPILIPSGARSWTPLMKAAYLDHAPEVRRLITKGVNLEEQERMNGWTALMVAAASNRYRMVRLLVSGGANLEALSRRGWTPLILAARSNHIETIRCLLDLGADPHHRSKTGMTAAQYAMEAGHESASRLILTERATPSSKLALIRRSSSLAVSTHLVTGGASLSILVESDEQFRKAALVL